MPALSEPRPHLVPRHVVIGCAVAFAATVVATTLLAAHHGSLDAGRTRTWSAIAVAIAAAVALAQVVRHRRSAMATGLSASLLTAALLAWSVGAALFAVEAADLGPVARWHLADPVYLLAGVLLTLFAATHPRLGNADQRLRVLLDASIVSISATVGVWLGLGRALHDRIGDPMTTFSAFLLPATDVMVIVAVLAALATSVTLPVRRTSSMLVAAAMAMTLVADLLGLAVRSYDLHPSVTLVAGASMVVGVGLIALAAEVAGGSIPLRFGQPSPRLSATLAAVPFVSAIVAAAATLGDAAVRGRWDPVAATVLTFVVCAVLLRQSLTLADNRTLAISLQRTIDGLELQATHDALTGRPNRVGLDERIGVTLQRAAQADRQAALLFMDLDHLKSVNDSMGHDAGDELIRTVAARLGARLGPRLTRFGGDEFVVLADDLADSDAAVELGRALVDEVSAPMEIGGRTIRASASVGIALAEPGAEPDELLRRADVALYRAKALGRGCVRTFDPNEDADRHRLDMGPELHRAVDRDEFEVHYQPIVELVTGQPVSAEALLRWRHPARGLLTPDAFLDEAISEGLLGAIGERTLRLVCADVARLDREPGPAGPLSVAVNLSSSELTDRRVAGRVRAALGASGLDPQRLTLEITEDVIVDDAIDATIHELEGLGVRFAVDDFGTGNSSLRQLSDYRAHALKIDRSFVERLEDDDAAVAVVRALIALATRRGMTTIAEGVETRAQARLLAELGCDRGQGWLYARALPYEELVDWCRTQPYRARRVSVASASSMMRASNSATGGRSSIAPTT